MNPLPAVAAIVQLLADGVWAKWSAYVKTRGGYRALIKAEIAAQEEYRRAWREMSLEEREAHRREMIKGVIIGH